MLAVVVVRVSLVAGTLTGPKAGCQQPAGRSCQSSGIGCEPSLVLPLMGRSALARVVNVASGAREPIDVNDVMLERC